MKHLHHSCSFIAALCLIINTMQAQTTTPYFYHSNTNNWSSNGIAANTYRALGTGNHQFTFQAGFTGSNFYKINNESNNFDNNFNIPAGSNVWSGNLTEGAIGTAFDYGDPNGSAGSFSVTIGKHYTYNWQDVNTSSNANAIVQETEDSPVLITTVTASPTVPNPSQNIIITITLDNLPTPQEKIYLRYSTNGFSSGYGTLLSAATGTGTTTQTFNIPAQPLNTVVTYYAFSSTLSNATLSGNAILTDMATLDINNNSGTNYTTSVLPVELTRFEAKLNGNSIDLNWVTALEEDNSHFDIERSADNKNWQKLTQIAGQGTKRTFTAYNYADEQPLRGINYYRLRQVDTDGAEQFSNVVNATMEHGTRYTIAPNPIENNTLRIVVDEPGNDDITCAIYSLDGSLLRTNTFASSAQMVWKLDGLTTGLYMVKIGQNEAVQIIVR